MKRSLKMLFVLMCIALMFAGCGIYEQEFGDFLAPDELTLSIAQGESTYDKWYGVSMPDAETTAYGASLTWKLK